MAKAQLPTSEAISQKVSEELDSQLLFKISRLQGGKKKTLIFRWLQNQNAQNKSTPRNNQLLLWNMNTEKLRKSPPPMAQIFQAI